MTTIATIHCLNQFFGGIGGEDQANRPPQFHPETKGPGLLIEKLAPQIKIVGTIVFGDNHAAENTEAAVSRIFELIEEQVDAAAIEKPELLLAGPAFNAGRYGMACGAICAAAWERLEIPATTAMFDENPGVDSYRKSVTIARCGDNVMAMPIAVERMTQIALKLVQGETVDPQRDHAFTRGLRQNYFASQTGAERAIEMLIRKLQGDPIATEYAMPVFERVTPAPAVQDISKTKIALVTSGGIVPRGNPDRIPSASAKRFGTYPVHDLDRLDEKTHQTVHGGYDPTYANADPNRVLPLDVVRELEREGRIGKLHDQYFSTVGNATSVANAQRFGQEIAAQLVNEGVNAVILTST